VFCNKQHLHLSKTTILTLLACFIKLMKNYCFRCLNAYYICSLNNVNLGKTYFMFKDNKMIVSEGSTSGCSRDTIRYELTLFLCCLQSTSSKHVSCSTTLNRLFHGVIQLISVPGFTSTSSFNSHAVITYKRKRIQV